MPPVNTPGCAQAYYGRGEPIRVWRGWQARPGSPGPSSPRLPPGAQYDRFRDQVPRGGVSPKR